MLLLDVTPFSFFFFGGGRGLLPYDEDFVAVILFARWVKRMAFPPLSHLYDITGSHLHERYHRRPSTRP